jgi:hypothetical protein
VRHIKEAKNAFDSDHKLHTYSIGIKGELHGRVQSGACTRSGACCAAAGAMKVSKQTPAAGAMPACHTPELACRRFVGPRLAQAPPTCRPRARSPTSWAPCTTSSPSPWRRASTRCTTSSGTSSRTSRWGPARAARTRPAWQKQQAAKPQHALVTGKDST